MQNNQNNQNHDRFYLLLFALIAFNLTWLNTEVLWDEDEGAYAGIIFNMVKTGDWVLPNFDWSTIHRKTPFHFWASAISCKLLNFNEFAFRLPGVLAILTTIFSLYALTKSIIGKKTATHAALILGASFFVPHLAKIALTDGWLLLFQTLAFLAMLNQVYAPHRRWAILLWGSVALGVLTKGPPIVITVGGAWVFCWIFLPKHRRALNALHPWFGFPLALLPFALWIYATIQRDGGAFAQFLLDWYVLNRVTSSVLGQTGPIGYHLLVMFISFLPFLPFLPSAFLQVFREARQRDTFAVVATAWLAFGWLFFELMTSKLPSYSLAAQPVLAILVARKLDTLDTEGVKKLEKIASIFWIILGSALSIALLVAIKLFAFKSQSVSNQLIMSALPTSLFLIIPPIVGTVAIFRQQVQRIFPIMLAMGIGTIFTAWVFIMPLVDKLPIKATRQVMEEAREMADFDTPLRICVNEMGLRQPSLVFYGVTKFRDCRVEENIKNLRTVWQSNKKMLIVTDSTQAEIFTNWLNEVGKNTPESRQINFWDTDDKLATKVYFILKNYNSNGLGGANDN